jgi:hypothetical protein
VLLLRQQQRRVEANHSGADHYHSHYRFPPGPWPGDIARNNLQYFN